MIIRSGRVDLSEKKRVRVENRQRDATDAVQVPDATDAVQVPDATDAVQVPDLMVVVLMVVVLMVVVLMVVVQIRRNAAQE